MRRQRERLENTPHAVAEIESFLGEDREEFMADRRNIVWVAAHLQIIGEAVHHLDPRLLARHPAVPWSDVVGLRHITVNGYSRIDPDILWSIATTDLGGLRDTVRRMVVELHE